ncbi:hypothetical protein ACOL22_11860, partial [Aliarcobacter butzleri]
QANIETIFRTNFLNCMNDYGIENIPLLQHYDYVKKGKRDIAVYFTIQNPKKDINFDVSNVSLNKDLPNYTEHGL